MKEHEQIGCGTQGHLYLVHIYNESDDCRFDAVLGHHGFFSCPQLFKLTVLNLTSLAGCRTWCPTRLQHFCCKALINDLADYSEMKPASQTFIAVMEHVFESQKTAVQSKNVRYNIISQQHWIVTSS